MSPLEIWCNESQERYVLAIPADRIDTFTQLCSRERAPFAIVGEATAAKQLIVEDPHFKNTPIDLPLDVLLGKPPRMHRVSCRASGRKRNSICADSICARPVNACSPTRLSPIKRFLFRSVTARLAV